MFSGVVFWLWSILLPVILISLPELRGLLKQYPDVFRIILRMGRLTVKLDHSGKPVAWKGSTLGHSGEMPVVTPQKPATWLQVRDSLLPRRQPRWDVVPQRGLHFSFFVSGSSGVSLDFSPSRKHSHAPQNWFRRPAHGAFRALASQRSAGLFACISLTPKLTTLCRKDQISSTAASPVSGTGRVSREYLPGKRHVKKVVSGPCKFQLSSSFSRIL